jgi:hypothetical protein
MHYRMFVTLDANANATSESVRRDVFDRLIADESFCGSGGRFGSSIADWFVIGGRWSGSLTEARLDEAYWQELRSELPGMAQAFVSDAYIRTNADALTRIWLKHGGSGMHPLVRNNYDELGAEDDALPLTRQHFETLLAEYPAMSECCEESWQCEYVDLDHDPLTLESIGRKWLVVVDYHN